MNTILARASGTDLFMAASRDDILPPDGGVAGAPSAPWAPRREGGGSEPGVPRDGVVLRRRLRPAGGPRPRGGVVAVLAAPEGPVGRGRGPVGAGAIRPRRHRPAADAGGGRPVRGGPPAGTSDGGRRPHRSRLRRAHRCGRSPRRRRPAGGVALASGPRSALGEPWRGSPRSGSPRFLRRTRLPGDGPPVRGEPAEPASRRQFRPDHERL